jgi:hypothetical protein
MHARRRIGHGTCLLALALAGPLPALARGSAHACGPLEGEYVIKNRFAPDSSLTVTRQGKDFRFLLSLYDANRPNDGSLTHNGSSEGRFSVRNCRAHVDDADNACSFNFTFKGRSTVSIVQEGDCQTFGANIHATGDYRKQ